MGNKRKRPELLLPAKGMEELRVALHYGADAVYVGGEQFSLRAGAKNFSIEELGQASALCHEKGKRLYVTVNIFAHEADLPGVREYFQKITGLGETSETGGRSEKPDALIISDPGIFQLAKECLPGMDLHVSTQANNTNSGIARFWQSLGASRIVTARELSIKEIRQMREQVPEDFEIETFVHGSMCISYSGRCLLSNVLTGRDANQGACTHPCRWSYALMEESREGEYFPIAEDARGSYVMNSRDLCMAGHIPELVSAGIDSFKIEGRMKNALYVAVCARTYRRALEDFLLDDGSYEARRDWYLEELSACTHRPYFTGFFFGKPGEGGQIYEKSGYEKGYVYLGFADGAGETFPFSQKNKFSVGESIEIMKGNGDNIQARVLGLQTEQGEAVSSCPHAGERLFATLSEPVEQYDVLRRRA